MDKFSSFMDFIMDFIMAGANTHLEAESNITQNSPVLVSLSEYLNDPVLWIWTFIEYYVHDQGKD